MLRISGQGPAIGFVLHFFTTAVTATGNSRTSPGAKYEIFIGNWTFDINLPTPIFYFIIRYSLFDIHDSIHSIFYPKTAIMQRKSQSCSARDLLYTSLLGWACNITPKYRKTGSIEKYFSRIGAAQTPTAITARIEPATG